MREQRINIAELLRDYPSGMELDCAICENVYFDKVDSDLIKCFIKNDVYEKIYFYRDGTHISAQNAKCVIFPKGKLLGKDFIDLLRMGMYCSVVLTLYQSTKNRLEGSSVDCILMFL